MKYNYFGHTSGVTLNVAGQPVEVMLFQGTIVDLPAPADNEWVATNIALGNLTPIPDADSAPTPKAAPQHATKKGAE